MSEDHSEAVLPLLGSPFQRSPNHLNLARHVASQQADIASQQVDIASQQSSIAEVSGITEKISKKWMVGPAEYDTYADALNAYQVKILNAEITKHGLRTQKECTYSTIEFIKRNAAVLCRILTEHQAILELSA